MIIAMFLAHLVGDYVLQWDSLAAWKAREIKGALAHGLVVGLVTWAFAAVFDAGWWPWVVFLWLSHSAVDAWPHVWRRWRAGRPALTTPFTRFLLDQVIHTGLIIFALSASGYLPLSAAWGGVLAALRNERLWGYALGYAFITMPAWILVEFSVYAVVNHSGPDFSQTTNKYFGIVERGLITTCVLLGQFFLVPLVVLPRLVFEGQQVIGSQRGMIYIAEWLVSLALAVFVGIGLRQL